MPPPTANASHMMKRILLIASGLAIAAAWIAYTTGQYLGTSIILAVIGGICLVAGLVEGE
jgi:uncharacterized membrane protein YccC